MLVFKGSQEQGYFHFVLMYKEIAKDLNCAEQNIVEVSPNDLLISEFIDSMAGWIPSSLLNSCAFLMHLLLPTFNRTLNFSASTAIEGECWYYTRTKWEFPWHSNVSHCLQFNPSIETMQAINHMWHLPDVTLVIMKWWVVLGSIVFTCVSLILPG